MGGGAKKVSFEEGSDDSVIRTPQTEKELRSLPDWPHFFLSQLNRADRLNVSTNLIWVCCSTVYIKHVVLAREYVEECKFLLADSDEFLEAKKKWGFHYRQIFLIRNMLVSYFGLRLPNFAVGANEVKPDRYITGVPLAKEDFIKIFKREPSEDSPFFLPSDDLRYDDSPEDVPSILERDALVDIGMIKLVPKTTEDIVVESETKNELISTIADEIIEAAEKFDMSQQEKVDAYLDKLESKGLL